MKGRCFRTLLCVVALVLLVPVVVAVAGCSSAGGAADAMDKLPKNAGGFTSIDVAALRDDGDLGDLYDQYKDQIKSSYDFLGISAGDVNRIISGGGVTILEGSFNLDDVRDELKDNDYNDDEYKGVETWEGGSSYWDAVALVDEGTIVVGSDINSVEDCIDVIKGNDKSLSEDEDISAAADKLPGGIYVQASSDDYSFDGLVAKGETMEKKDSDTVLATGVFLFDDDNAAEDAKSDIKDSYKDDYNYDNVEVTQDGKFVIVTGEMDIADLTS